MISTITHKRKSSLDNSNITKTTNNNSMLSLTKRFRGIAYDGKNNQNEHRMSLLSSTIKSEQEPKKMTIANGEQNKFYKRFDESEMTPTMLTEYRRLQHDLQCQEALLVLMQKLKSNQKLVSQTNNNNNNNNNSTTNNNGIKQRTTTPTTATKLSQQSTLNDGKTPLTATKQPLINNSNRSIPTKPPHPNQYTVNRSNNNSQISQQQSSKNSLSTSQATRQSNNNINNNNNNTLPAAATRISSTVPTTATKNSSVTSNTSNSSKSNGVAAEQHLLNAKLALRKQLEQTLLQIPTPKPSTCDLTFIPGVNGWSEFLAYLGLEQALNTYTDIVNRRPTNDISMTLPYVCAQCGTDWSVTWHEMSLNSDTNSDDKILCDRCTKTSQKKLLKQDHSNRLRQAFIKALQQEKELDAKFQQQSSSSTPSTPSSTTTTTPTISTVKQSSSSQQQQQQHSKHSHQTNKHSNKPLSTKTSSNHHHHHHNNNSTNNNNHHSHSHSHSHHHHSGKSSSSSSKSHNTNPSLLSSLTPSPAETLASTLAALQTNEQMELFQKHFLSNMLPFAVANQTAAAAFATKSTQQQQQQAALAALPAMAASLMRQPNPAQYLLDMIPQAAKHQQQQQQQHHHHHHHHSK